MDNFLKTVGAAVIFAAAIILIIPLSSLLGLFVGFILKITVGGAIVKGLNYLFGTTRFTASQLPYICAALAVIGGYLRTSVKHDKD
jgi:hypothetical protein